jgi:hypothetical protein
MIAVQNTKSVTKPEMLDFHLMNFKLLKNLRPLFALPYPSHRLCRREIDYTVYAVMSGLQLN